MLTECAQCIKIDGKSTLCFLNICFSMCVKGGGVSNQCFLEDVPDVQVQCSNYVLFFLSFLKITCSHHHGKTAYVQSTLDSHHAYFLLADNGTEGEYGAEVIFRRRIERHLYQQKVSKGTR